MTEPIAGQHLIDLAKSFDFGSIFGVPIFGVPITYLLIFMLFTLPLLMTSRFFNFRIPDFSFDWIRDLRRTEKTKEIGFIHKILLHLKLAEIKKDGER